MTHSDSPGHRPFGAHAPIRGSVSADAERAVAPLALRSATGTAPETFCTSGTSPTLHVVGAGAVGRAVLTRIAASATHRLVAVTDSSGTVLRRDWLDPRAILEHKAAGGSIASLPGASDLRTGLAADIVDADIVVDATPSGFDRVAEAVGYGDAVLRRGGRLALASKAALSTRTDAWLGAHHRSRVGINAVLGGAGLALRDELEFLRGAADGAALCGNATTTRIIETVEQGGSIADGIAAARDGGLLEPDPELDLTGYDAAVKLAIVAGALGGAPVDPASIQRPDVRTLAPETIRERAARGATTRLVGRLRRDPARGGAPSLSLTFEELPASSSLVAPWDRVVYGYDLGDDSLRVHTGSGVGPEGTADAVWADVLAFDVPASPATQSAGGAR